MIDRLDMINRIAEQQFLRTFLETHLGERKTLILCSPTGVGKSYLVDQVVSKMGGSVTYAAAGKGTKYEGVTYIQQIASALNDCAVKDAHFETLSQFRNIQRAHDKSAAIKIAGIVKKAVGEVATGEIPTIGEGLAALATAGKPVDALLYEDNSDAIQICEAYVRYVLKRNAIVLRINKYNEIDELSDIYLKNIFNNADKTVLVLELTTSGEEAGDSELLIQIKTFFVEDGFEYRRLDEVHLSHIIEPYKNRLGKQNFDVEDFVSKAYLGAKGNFNKLNLLISDKISRPTVRAEFSYEEQVKSLIQDMPNDCRLFIALLAIVPVHLSVRSISNLWSRGLPVVDSDIKVTLDLFETRYQDLVEIGPDHAKIRDDIVKSHLLVSPLLERDVIVSRTRLLEQLHRENSETRSGDRYYSNIILIISLVIQGGGSGDSSILLSALKKLDLHQFPSNKGELAQHTQVLFDQYILSGRKNVIDQSGVLQFDMVYEEICKILYRLGHLEKLIKMAAQYSRFLPVERHSDALRLTVLSAQVLNGDKAALREIEKIDKKNMRLYYGSRLLLILYYRVFDDVQKAKREWKKLKNTTGILDSPYRAIFYEYGALIYPVNILKKISFFRKAKQYHIENKNNFHIVSCSLGIAAAQLQLPVLSKRKIALSLKEMETHSHLFRNVRMMDHILENQEAILVMHKGQYTENTIETLITAYNKCAYVPDKLLIGANLINCYVSMRQKGESAANIDVYVKDILRYGRIYKNKNSEFARYSLSSCYKYFVHMDDKPMLRELEGNDLSYMSNNFLFYNIGPPRNFFLRIFTKYIYSYVYLRIWPKILPVYNWSIDFYSIDRCWKQSS